MLYKYEVTLQIDDDVFVEIVHARDPEDAEYNALDLHSSDCYPWHRKRDDDSWYDGCEILKVIPVA